MTTDTEKPTLRRAIYHSQGLTAQNGTKVWPILRPFFWDGSWHFGVLVLDGRPVRDR